MPVSYTHLDVYKRQVQEHVHLVDYCVSHVAGRCKVVAGSGSNDTAAALYLCQHRCV